MSQSSQSHTESRHRVDVFDGLRGVAIVLVVLSHGWALWPSTYTLGHRPLSTLFASGNFAVSIFFAVGAFVATRALLRKAHSPPACTPWSTSSDATCDSPVRWRS